MSEDVSSQVRTGVTIILVASLVAAVLNLMVVAQSILNTGMSTLQSGVDQITMQEFEAYNQKKKTGTEVRSAVSLYEGRDIAIVIRTKSCIDNNSGGAWAYVYGSLLQGATVDAGNASGLVYRITAALPKNAGDSFYTAEYLLETGGGIQSNNNTTGIITNGDSEFVLQSVRFRAELIKNSTGSIIGILFTQLS